MIKTLVELDRPDEALKLFEETKGQAESDSNFFSLAASAGILGKRDEARIYIAKHKEMMPSDFRIAWLHCLIDETDQAMVILEEAYENKSNWITRLGWMRDQSGWSVLRDDPRFEELLKKIGIPL